MKNPLTAQEDPRGSIQGLIGDMKREHNKLVGEIAKHVQFEKTQIELANTYLTQGGDAPGVESKEMETAREANKMLLNNRCREIEEIVGAAESLIAQEQRDYAVVTEVLKVSHAAGTALGQAQAKALAMTESYNQLYTEIANTRSATKTLQNQQETNQESATTRDNMTETIETLKSQTKSLEDILGTTKRYNEELKQFIAAVSQQETTGGLPEQTPFENTLFQEAARSIQCLTQGEKRPTRSGK